MTVLYPTVIAPLFNTFRPLDDDALARDIEALVQAQGFRVEGVLQMDAGRRTRHSNAYFSGLGRSKRIVLFDTLLEAHSRDEILAILAHEVGHLKKRHIKMQLALVAAVSGILLYAAARLMLRPELYTAFGFASATPWAGLFLAGVLWEPLGFFLSPAAMAISRRFEVQADRFAVDLMQTAKPLTAALKRLAKDNLASLHPHPAFVFFNYSHPPLLDRIQAIAAAGGSSVGS